MQGSWIAMKPYHVVSNGVDPMVVPNLMAYVSMWLLLALAWKPLYYVVMYFVGVAQKDTVKATKYGMKLHDWITALWGLVL